MISYLKFMDVKYIGLFLLFFAFSSVAFTQEKGALTGSFETNSIYYFKDSKIGAERPADRFGSNNYLKLDYNYGKFAVGIQFEGYYPVLQGYPSELKDSKIINKYVRFSDGNFKIQVGDFYDQFGSGLIFRSWEDRALGLNNAIEGVNATYRFGNLLELKAMWGHQRKCMAYVDGQLRGMDATLRLSELLQLPVDLLTLEGSWVNKYQKYTGENAYPENVDAYSGRINFSHRGWNVKGEYVAKGKDPLVGNFYSTKKGNALLVEVGYAGEGLGIQLSGRRLEYMDFRSERDASGIEGHLNYIPALTRQYEYALTNINPYSVMANGEIGGQFDLFYNIPKKTLLGGKYGTKLHINASTYNNLKVKDLEHYEFLALGTEKLYSDVSLDVQKKWNRKIKTILLASYQQFNPLVIGKGNTDWRSFTAVGDITWQMTPKNAIRLELQHLWSGDYLKNWAYVMAEYSFVPSWTVYGSDMYNYGVSEIHYYNAGFSYSKNRTRCALSYGRTRDGYQCSGGVCRSVPAYTGINLAITSSF
ncbi:MAG: DUF6029 family protein [Odoribacter sp.]